MLTRKLFACLLLSGFFAAPSALADLVFSSPPRESRAKGEEVYQPIADYLSKVTGQKVIYRYPDNWLVYQRDMQKGIYDIVFDGPAFIGWRQDMQGHVPLVKLPGKLSFVLVVKKEQQKIRALRDLAGRSICAFPPPNLATLTVLYEFDNPSRQPLIVETQSFPGAYEGVMNGKCVAGILQTKIYEKLAAERDGTKVIFSSRGVPNQAFTAGPRLVPELKAKITQALLSSEGKVATRKLLAEFKLQDFEPATKEEYAGLGKLLRDVWGFDLAESR
ncbi:MAG: phosphate/phosphite/phosphonate ABC transporter substrate-binding protein [Sulfuricaulis sp.]